VLARDWQKIKKTEAAKRMGSGLKHPSMGSRSNPSHSA
jgi:hypothetical protein